MNEQELERGLAKVYDLFVFGNVSVDSARLFLHKLGFFTEEDIQYLIKQLIRAKKEAERYEVK